MAVSPVDLDESAQGALKKALPQAVYEGGRSTVSVRLPADPEARFAAVVTAAEALLEVTSAPSPPAAAADTE